MCGCGPPVTDLEPNRRKSWPRGGRLVTDLESNRRKSWPRGGRLVTDLEPNRGKSSRPRSGRTCHGCEAAGLATVQGGWTPGDEGAHLACVAVQAPVAERVLGLHQLVDLRRALVDDRGPRVAEVALEAVLGRVAVRTEDLDREMRCLEGGLRRVPLGQ